MVKDNLYISTGMYADDTEKILKLLCLAMEHSWQVQRKFAEYGLSAISFERAPDNEILLLIKLSSNSCYSRTWRFWNRVVERSFYDNKMNANEAKRVLEKFGWNIKRLARGFAIRHMNLNATGTDELKYAGNQDKTRQLNAEVNKYFNKHIWTRTNGLKIKRFISIDDVTNAKASDVEPTVADIYFIYEKLIGRLEKSTKRYDNAVVRRLVGEPRDVISTEAEVARREEVARINKEYDEKIADLDTNYSFRNGRHSAAYDELQELIAEFKAKCSSKQQKLKAERDAKIAEVNAACQFLIV